MRARRFLTRTTWARGAMLRGGVLAAGLALALGPARADDRNADDWATFGRFLSVLQVVVQTAARDDGGQAQQAIDEILAGRNAQANALAREILVDVPDAEREKMIAIGRSLAELGQKQAALDARAAAETRAIQARKDLAGMGLVYHDSAQFLAAVRRGDLIAVRLFLAGRGVDPNATDVWGTSALELARRAGDPELAAVLAAAGAR